MTFEDLEKARQQLARKAKIFIAIGFTPFILAIIIAIISLLSSNHAPLMGAFALGTVGLFSAIIIAIIGVIATRKESKNYHKMYKKYFVERNLRQIFTNIFYDHERGMPKDVLKSTDMIRTGDVYSSNDFTSGKYKDVAFAQADVHIQEAHTDSDGNTNYITIFKGRWMVFVFPKKFTFRLQVIEKWFTAGKKFSKNRETKRKVEKITTESPTFNKKFKVYAEDGFEAYYILDPAFIDHIETLSATHKGKLLLCFVDNKLHVAINDNQDAFEPGGVFKPLNEATENQKILSDIKTITDFVDFLKLDHKLFKN